MQIRVNCDFERCYDASAREMIHSPYLIAQPELAECFLCSSSLHVSQFGGGGRAGGCIFAAADATGIHQFSPFFGLQNASLTVLTEGSHWTTSSGSSWDPNDAEHPDEGDDNTPPEAPLETWLLMECCDKGNLLVSTHSKDFLCIICMLRPT